MAEQHKPAQSPPPVSGPPKDGPPARPVRLGEAGSSGDPAVQDLLALREVHERNGDKAGIRAVDDALAGWGVTV